LLRFLLIPFSLLYGIAVFIRNKLYDKKIFGSTEFDIPVICVGNLSAGGTGKTPMIEYLVSLLNEFYKTGTLSRGYKRRTTGFLIANENSTAEQAGDEPLQLKKKFPDTLVAVGEDRMLAIPEMLATEPELQVILLDDAFQHRSVKAGLNILLTPYDSPFYNDRLLPAGRLREQKSGAERADIVIVTRTPESAEESSKQKVKREINCYTSAPVFFSGLKYGKAYPLFNNGEKQLTISDFKSPVILFCGIAHPDSLINYLKNQDCIVHPILFPDHHFFTQNDLEKLLQLWNRIQTEKKIILTTEKDATRLAGFKDWFTENKPDVWVQPVKSEFQENDKNQLNKLIFDFLKKQSHS